MDELEADTFMHAQEKYCWSQLQDHILANLTDVHCPPIFDGILCWPPAEAPGTVSLPCPPRSILGYNYTLNSTATKVCMATGGWYRNQEMITWTNYSSCLPPPGQYVTAIQDIQISHMDYEISNNTLFHDWLPIVKIVSQIGYATSFIALIIAMVVFSLLRKLRNPRNRLHMHLFASFIMRAFMALLKDWLFVDGVGLPWDVVSVDGKSTFIKERNIWVCKAITSFWQYFIVANYAWILMEGLYLHNLVYLALCADTSSITIYALMGWVMPLLVTTVWIIVRIFMEDTLCWTTHNNPSLFLIIRIPIMISILLNFILYINIVRVLLLKMKNSAQLQQRKKMAYGRWARSTLVLVPLFGAHYTLFLGLSYYKDPAVELTWLFSDQFFASFQGCFVAFLYCLLNDEVRDEVRRVWQVQKSRREDSLDLSHRKLVKTSQQNSKKLQQDSKENVNVPTNISTL